MLPWKPALRRGGAVCYQELPGKPQTRALSEPWAHPLTQPEGETLKGWVVAQLALAGPGDHRVTSRACHGHTRSLPPPTNLEEAPTVPPQPNYGSRQVLEALLPRVWGLTGLYPAVSPPECFPQHLCTQRLMPTYLTHKSEASLSPVHLHHLGEPWGPSHNYDNSSLCPRTKMRHQT